MALCGRYRHLGHRRDDVVNSGLLCLSRDRGEECGLEQLLQAYLTDIGLAVGIV